MPNSTFFKQIDQQRAANLLIFLFLVCSLAGIILIASKYYQIFYVGIEEASLIQETNFIRLFVECFSGILIVIAWLTLMKETKKIGGDPDWGLAWLAMAILCWCVGGLIHIVFEFHDAFGIKKQHTISPVLNSVTSRIISTFNSFCFLFSLQYLEFGEKSRWKKLRDWIGKVFTVKTTAFILFTIVILTIFLGIQFKNSNSIYVYLPDLVLSFVTTAALWIFFTEYFEQRKIDYMGFFISIVVVVIILVQLGHFMEPKLLNQFLIRENAPILNMIYRPFLITLFLLVAFSSLRNEKEKQALLSRRDMNHAIRGSLHILNHDIKRLSNQSKVKEGIEQVFILQDLEFRIKAIYDLHNLIHNEYSDEKISVEKYLNSIVENTKYAFEYTHINTSFVNVNKLMVNRSLLRKIGVVMTELMINAAKVAITKSIRTNSQSNFNIEDKLLAVEVEKQSGNLKISISDNGIYEANMLTKNSAGHGLNLIKRIIREDFEGELNLFKNKWEGTTILASIPLKNII